MTTVEQQSELRDRLIAGLKLAYERLLEEKKKNKSELVVIRDGKMVRIKPQ